MKYFSFHESLFSREAHSAVTSRDASSYRETKKREDEGDKKERGTTKEREKEKARRMHTYRTSQAALIFRNARRVRGYAGGVYEEYAAARPRGRQRPQNDGVARRVTVDVLATLSATSFVSFPFHFQL